MLAAFDLVPDPAEAPARGRIGTAVRVLRATEGGVDDLREVLPPEADQHRDQHGDQDDRPGVGLPVGLADPGHLQEDAQRVVHDHLLEVLAEEAEPPAAADVRVVREEPAEHAPQDPGEDEAGVAAQDPFEDPAAAAADPLAALLDPPRPAQEQRREEQEEEERTGEEQAEAPRRDDGRRPGRFGAQGAQGVGEDAGGVEPVGGRGEPFFVDVQLLDDPVAVGGVEVGARAQEASRLRRRRVGGGPAVRCSRACRTAAHALSSVGRRETVRRPGGAG